MRCAVEYMGGEGRALSPALIIAHFRQLTTPISICGRDAASAWSFARIWVAEIGVFGPRIDWTRTPR